jgi:transposase-like protein
MKIEMMDINENALARANEKEAAEKLVDEKRRACAEYFFRCLRVNVCPKCGKDLIYFSKNHFFHGLQYSYTCSDCGLIYNNKD